MSTSGIAWFVVRVRSRCEKSVSRALTNKGFECFLPLYRVRRAWKTWSVDRTLPLFSGYVFCRFDALRPLPVLTTPGVVHILGFGRIPAPVEEEQIEAIRKVVNSGAVAEPWRYLTTGDLVAVATGPLKGTRGIVIKMKNNRRLVISIHMICRSIAVEIDAEAVLPALRRRPAIPFNAALTA